MYHCQHIFWSCYHRLFFQTFWSSGDFLIFEDVLRTIIKLGIAWKTSLGATNKLEIITLMRNTSLCYLGFKDWTEDVNVDRFYDNSYFVESCYWVQSCNSTSKYIQGFFNSYVWETGKYIKSNSTTILQKIQFVVSDSWQCKDLSTIVYLVIWV